MKTIIKGITKYEPTELELKNRQLARQAAAEGFVLLKNDGVLPLKDKKIALYGSGVRKTVKGGTGSGAVRERYSVTIEQGLLNAGYEITTLGWLDRFDRFYADTYEQYRQEMEKKVEGIREFYKILGMIPPFRHPTGISVTEEDIAASACDTAIFVIARQAGEGNDRVDAKGDFRLDDIEYENLKTLSIAYKNFIVVINVGGVIDVSFLDEFNISALVYFVQGGEEGGNAFADVMSGKTGFSGRLATSWAYKFEDIPSNSTYSYLGGDKFNQEYNEGIYVGYRYFDSFGVKPRFAFGFGLSYTEFEICSETIKTEKGAVTVAAEVKNIGKASGKEVVQLYASVPFGDGGSELKRLVGFAKTKELQPGESEKATVKVPFDLLSVYSPEKAAWILRAGEYVLRIGNSSDNTRPVAVLELGAESILEQCENVCPPQHDIDEIFPPKRAEENLSGLPRFKIDGCLSEAVRHDYSEPTEEIDALTASMNAEELATLLVGGGTSAKNLQVAALGASGTTTPLLYDSLGIPNIILSDGPTGLNLTSQVVQLPDGSYKAAKVPETLEAYRRYLFGFSRIALMSQMAEPSDGEVHYQYATAWPCSQLVAQTFDLELSEKIGRAVGEEMEAFGVTVWLAPGMNIHRNPLCGRTFEYYSEDPFVSGKTAAALTKGVQSVKGKGVSVKHFAANSCELERNFSSSNMSERALREIYLKGFEIAVKEAEPMTVMAAYNKINGVYCTNNYDLLTKVLRCEWGFKGLVMSDWDAMKADRGDCEKPLSGDVQKAHSAGCDLVMPGLPAQVEAIKKGIDSGKVDINDLRQSAVRLLKIIRENTVLKIK